MEDVPDNAATSVQYAWKSRKARRKYALMNLEHEKMKRYRGTIRIRKVVRSQQARIRVQKKRNLAN
jgi:hypothetical protein